MEHRVLIDELGGAKMAPPKRRPPRPGRKRPGRNNRKPKTGGPSLSSQQALFVLNLMVRQGYRMYEGTVPAKVKARRRAANRAARISRRVNRGSRT